MRHKKKIAAKKVVKFEGIVNTPPAEREASGSPWKRAKTITAFI
jgi:hypothetical protein